MTSIRSIRAWTAVTLIASTMLCAPVSQSAAAGLASAEDATPRGLAIRYFPAKGYVNIREFSLAGSAATDRLQTLVSEATWCDEHFNFELLDSVEERMETVDGSVNAECHLLSKTDEVDQVLQDVISGVLDRPVGAGIKDGELRASFDYPEGDLELDHSNAEGLYTRSNGRAMMIWKLPQQVFEAVWVVGTWPETATPLRVPETIKSPELDEAALEALKQKLRGQ